MTVASQKKVLTIFVSLVALVLLAGRADVANAQTGCEPVCSGYPANAKSISCACRAICAKLQCPAGSGAPSFIESKQCPPGPSTPAHTVSRICCTAPTGRVRCKPFPSCKTMSRS